MDDDGLFFELFAAEFGPEKGQDDAHEKDDDGTGRIGNGGSDSDGGSGDEGGAVGELFGAANEGISEHGAEEFAVAAPKDCAKTATPFRDGVDKRDAGEAFGEEEDSGDGDEVGIGGVGFDKNEVADDGD